jgi:putative membrane protein
MNYYLAQWIVSSLSVLIMARVVPGITVDGFVAALMAALAIGFVNMVVYPIMMLLTIPLTILSFGLFLFVLNGLALKLAAAITPGFTIVGFMPAFLGAIVLSILAWLVRVIFHGPQMV